MEFSYSFSLPAPAHKAAPLRANAPAQPAPAEFVLDLPAHWRQTPSHDGASGWYSDQEAASITVSADLYAIPDGKAELFARQNIASRKEALARSTARRVVLLQENIEPHAGAHGLEMNLGLEVEGECIYLYLGYVTPRKIFNFTLVSRRDFDSAVALYDRVMGGLRIRLP